MTCPGITIYFIYEICCLKEGKKGIYNLSVYDFHFIINLMINYQSLWDFILIYSLHSSLLFLLFISGIFLNKDFFFAGPCNWFHKSSSKQIIKLNKLSSIFGKACHAFGRWIIRFRWEWNWSKISFYVTSFELSKHIFVYGKYIYHCTNGRQLLHEPGSCSNCLWHCNWSYGCGTSVFFSLFQFLVKQIIHSATGV